jgi:nucleoside 2-deoxyribosyltransferase
MNDQVTCPICQGQFGICYGYYTPRDTAGFQCEGCGKFEVTRTALVDWFNDRRHLTPLQKAAMSHALRTGNRGSGAPMVTTDWLARFVSGARLPTPAQQASNLIRIIGDAVADTGDGYFIDDVVDTPLIGAINRAMFSQLLSELIARNLLVRLVERHQVSNPRGDGVLQGSLWGLSLDGWERYESEQRGRGAARYGFIAMKFGDAVLDPFIDQHVKPAVRDRISYDLVDLRNVSRAGVIDNILREQIRDAAFVLVDLTHDNSGAYWEAGYAEGLGKPVVYICERGKFDAAKTHFDTNHCTTVMWTQEEPMQFVDELVATVRRSLNLFAEAA